MPKGLPETAVVTVMTLAMGIVPRGRAAAWCYANDEPGGPVTVHDVFWYDLKTLQPPVGPVVADWARRFARDGRYFAVAFTGVGDTIGATTRWTNGRWIR